MLRTSSQDGGFRLENLKSTLSDMLRFWLLMHLEVSRGWTYLEHMYVCVYLNFDAMFS